MSARLANRRIRLLLALFGAVFVVALLRAAWLQAVRGPSLERRATSQQREPVTIPARRGTIFDRKGIALAISESATTIFANPKQIKDPRAVAEAVGEELGLDTEEVLPELADRSRGFVFVERKADLEGAERLERRNIEGLGFSEEERRAYPQRAVASEVIGFAGLDKGLEGLEFEYDRVLAGRAGSRTIVRDPLGHTLDVVDDRPVRNGHDLYLTLDYRIQADAEKVLRQTRANWGAKSATAVVLDPRTGGVLAMAVEPGFDANRFQVVPGERFRNRAVTDTFEPGSTFKVVTVAGALEDGLVNPGTSFKLRYSIKISDRVIHDVEKRGTEQMTVSEIVSRSSNVGAVTLALGLGKERLGAWIERFGLGRPTGIDFPGESSGIVIPTEEWSGSTIGNVPIGQGIAVTPMQLASAYATIANGGLWIEPHLVKRVAGLKGAVKRPKRRQVISRQTARQLARMLEGVVSEGSGAAARVPGFRVAGKTGTAAKPEPAGGYSKYRYVASFVGFVPARSPRLVILVAVDEPRGAIFGGTVAAPAFAKIARRALTTLEVRPDFPGFADA